MIEEPARVEACLPCFLLALLLVIVWFLEVRRIPVEEFEESGASCRE